MGSRLNETFTQNKLRNRRSKLWTESPSDVLKSSQVIKLQNLRTCLDLLILNFFLVVPFLVFPSLPMMFPHFLAENSSHFTFFICQLRWAPILPLTPHTRTGKTDWLLSQWQGRPRQWCVERSNWKLVQIYSNHVGWYWYTHTQLHILGIFEMPQSKSD